MITSPTKTSNTTHQPAQKKYTFRSITTMMRIQSSINLQRRSNSSGDMNRRSIS